MNALNSSYNVISCRDVKLIRARRRANGLQRMWRFGDITMRLPLLRSDNFFPEVIGERYQHIDRIISVHALQSETEIGIGGRSARDYRCGHGPYAVLANAAFALFSESVFRLSFDFLRWARGVCRS